MVMALIVALIVTVMVSITATMSLSAYRTTRTESQKGQAFFAAQSGLERATARAKQLDVEASAGLARTINTNVLAAQWLADRLGLTGTLPGGTYTVTASVTAGSTSTAPALLTLTSQGYDPGTRGTRRLQISFPVTVLRRTQTFSPLIGAAPAALTVTGNSRINGNAPITGEAGAAGDTHLMSCPPAFAGAATCTRSQSSPPQYTLQYKGGVPSTFQPGVMLRPTQVGTNEKSEERYVVESVSATGQVVMTVLSDYISTQNGAGFRNRTFASSGDIAMREINTVPALLLPPGADFSNVSANVRAACDMSECSRYTISPDDLFKSVMGDTKDNTQALFERLGNGMYDTDGTAECTPPVKWLEMGKAGTQVNHTTANLRECTTPQLLVVDAREQESLTLNLPTQAAFRGLLYVIAKPGVNVSVQGNVGFAGAMILDNGNGGIDLLGNGQFNEDCEAIRIGNGRNLTTPKLCYDSDIMAEVRQRYIDDVLSLNDLDLTLNSQNWREVAND